MSLFEDLKRRRIFRAIGLYAAGAWLVTEIASVVFEGFDVPQWALRFVMITAVGGFPVAMLLAWQFDWTRHGLRRSPGQTGWFAWAMACLMAASATVAAFYITYPGDERMTAIDGFDPPANSIAVLPFTNFGPEGNANYFSDGIAEEILNGLAQIDGLHVAARTSSFLFRDKDVDIPTVGRQLNVGYVLEGSVRRDQAENRLRVTAQLIDARDGFHEWSQNFDDKLEAIFDIQERISRRIVDQLEIALIDDKPGKVLPAGTISTDAHELYLLGQHYLAQRTPEAIAKAQENFERATAADPDYAIALTGLAQAHIFAVQHADGDRDTAKPAAESLIRRALQLQPGLAAAHAALCTLKFVTDRDMNAAEAACARAVELNPNSSQYRMWLANTLSDGGRLDLALLQYDRALELDPLNTTLMVNAAETEMQLLEFGRATELLDRAQRLRDDYSMLPVVRFLNAFSTGDVDALRSLMTRLDQQPEIGPSSMPIVRVMAGMTEMMAGNAARVAGILQPVCSTDDAKAGNFDSFCRTTLGLAYQQLDRHAEADALLNRHEQALDRSTDLSSPFLHFSRSGLYAVQGDIGRATESMRRAQELGAMYYGFIRHDPRFEQAWQHPDFAAVMGGTRARIAAMRESISVARGL